MSYRTDPAWLAARADYTDDVRDGEKSSDAFVRRVVASVAMFRIETEHAATLQEAQA